MRSRMIVLPALTVLVLIGGVLAIPSFADSQARIVRLSQVDGDVRIDRNSGGGFEKAFLNLPITQGMMVKTGFDGRAEVELEDGSAIRMTPNTVISFPDLSLRDSGGKVSTVNLQEGTAYVNFLDSKNDKSDELMLTFGKQKLALTEAVHLRLQLGDANATVAVFKGEARVTGPSGEVEVAKNKTAVFDLASDKYELAKNLEPDPYDEWDKQQTQYHDRYMASNSYSNTSPYAYGASDLNYYGNFATVPGYGNLWQPYFAGAGWDPYMNGAWAYSPGYGYGWVSGYPWGWTPYHSGTWVYVPSYGWGWQPGGSWAGLNAQPTIAGGPAGFIPPKPPAAGTTTVAVNRGGSFPRTTTGYLGSKMTIPENSAGLGVPRGLVRNLGTLSQRAQKQGTASTRLPSSSSLSGFPSGYPSSGASGGGRSGGFTARSVGPSHSSGGHSAPHR
jgi:FecR protein